MRTAPPNPKRVAYGGTDVNTPLAVPFEFQDAADIKVTSRVIATGIDTVLVNGSQYTVTGGAGATGTVTPVDGATDFASTVSWIITGDEDYEQDTNLVQGDDTPHDALEIQLDRIVDQITELKEEVNRCIKIPVGDLTGTSVEVDNEVDRANKYLIYDGSGNPSTLATGASGGTDLIIASGDRYVSTTARTAAQRWSEIIRVEDYGITATDTDNYAAMQSLIDKVCVLSQNPNGADIIFGNGSYRTDSELLVWAGGIRVYGQGKGITTNQLPSGGVADRLNHAATMLYTGVDHSGAVIRFAPKDNGVVAEEQNLVDCGIHNILVSGAYAVANNTPKADECITVENCFKFRGSNFSATCAKVSGFWAHEVTPVGGGSTQGVAIDGYDYDYGREPGGYESDGMTIGDKTVAAAGVVFSSFDNISGLVYNGDLIGMRGGGSNNRIGNVFWQAGGGGTGNAVAFYNDGAAGLSGNNHLAYANGPVYAQSGTFNTAGELLASEGSIHIESGAVLKRNRIVDPVRGAVWSEFGNPMKSSLWVSAAEMIPSLTHVTTPATAGEFGVAATNTGLPCIIFADAVDEECVFSVVPPREWGYGFIRSITFVWGADIGWVAADQTVVMNIGITSAIGKTDTLLQPTSGAGFVSAQLVSSDYIAGQYEVDTVQLTDINGATGGILCEKNFNSANVQPARMPGVISCRLNRIGTDGSDDFNKGMTLLGVELRHESIGPAWQSKATVTFNGTTNEVTHPGTDTNYKTDNFGPVRFFTTLDSLPAGLQTDTDYWLSYTSDTIVTLLDGPSGTPVTFTGNGTGTKYMYKAINVGDDAI